MTISKNKLTFWATNGYNVCMSGKHGVGKTAQIKEIFNELYGELGKDWLYFSASNMDPWVDFVGVPKEKVAEDGVSYLTLVRPEMFARDQVKAIFIDEFNRAQKKVRNATMELLQFGAINGHKFHNLKIVWTAINPPDEEDTYDVDEIDPAQLDRFHIFVDIPYRVSREYFISKYGKDEGTAAVEWWNSLPIAVKDKVSPRRLDYAIDCYQKNGDIRDVLPKEANSKQLLALLSYGSIRDSLKELFKDKDEKLSSERLSDPNFFELAKDIIVKKDEYISFFAPLMPSERFSGMISTMTPSGIKKFLNVIGENDIIHERVKEILSSMSVKGAKKKALNEWRLKFHTPKIPKAAKKSNISSTLNDAMRLKIRNNLEVLVDSAHVENTYHRRNTIEMIVNEYRNKDLDADHIKLFYEYMVTACQRSHLSTVNSLPERVKKNLNKMFNKFNTKYKFSDYMNDFIQDNSVISKMRYSKIISSAIAESVDPPF